MSRGRAQCERPASAVCCRQADKCWRLSAPGTPPNLLERMIAHRFAAREHTTLTSQSKRSSGDNVAPKAPMRGSIRTNLRCPLLSPANHRSDELDALWSCLATGVAGRKRPFHTHVVVVDAASIRAVVGGREEGCRRPRVRSTGAGSGAAGAKRPEVPAVASRWRWRAGRSGVEVERPECRNGRGVVGSCARARGRRRAEEHRARAGRRCLWNNISRLVVSGRVIRVARSSVAPGRGHLGAGGLIDSTAAKTGR
jgi:hypothetical protein